MNIKVDYLDRCIATLENAYLHLQRENGEDSQEMLHDIFRAACVKEFELVLEQSNKLLKKRLSLYFATNQAVDKLSFKDIFRHAVAHALIDLETCERWLLYRDHRNNTAHDYGENYVENLAEIILELLPRFIQDAKALSQVIAEGLSDEE